jgi:hypothetical protein
MKDATEKVVFVMYGLLGSGLGFLVFMFALDGWRFVFTGRSTAPWNGIAALIATCLLGGGWGLVSYMLKYREFASRSSPLFQDRASALLFSKRLMVIATSGVAAYIMWQVARSI